MFMPPGNPARSRARKSLTMGVLTVHPNRGTLCAVLSRSWTTESRCASSSPPAAPRSARNRPGCPPPGNAACRAAAQRGRRAGRDERGVLRQARTRHPGRRLRRRARRAGPRAAARRRRTGPPAAAGPGGRRLQQDPAPPRPEQWTVRPSLQWTLDAITTAPAIVGNDRLDFLAANQLGRAMYCDLFSTRPPTELRPLHLPRQLRPTLLPELGPRRRHGRRQPATAAGKDPHDKGLHELVGELSTRSEEFRRRWHAHDVRTHGTGVKHFHHHVVGDLELAYESLDLRAEPGLTLTVYAAEPASPTADALSCSPPGPPQPTNRPRPQTGRHRDFVTAACDGVGPAGQTGTAPRRSAVWGRCHPRG